MSGLRGASFWIPASVSSRSLSSVSRRAAVRSRRVLAPDQPVVAADLAAGPGVEPFGTALLVQADEVVEQGPLQRRLLGRRGAAVAEALRMRREPEAVEEVVGPDERHVPRA